MPVMIRATALAPLGTPTPAEGTSTEIVCPLLSRPLELRWVYVLTSGVGVRPV